MGGSVKRRQKESLRRPSALEQLPNELLDSIVGRLVNYDKKHLAQVSKRFRDAVFSAPFDTIIIRVSTPEGLKEDAASIITMIKAFSGFQRFRRLEIRAEIRGREKWDDHSQPVNDITVYVPGYDDPVWPPVNPAKHEPRNAGRPTILRHQDETERQHELDLRDWQRAHHTGVQHRGKPRLNYGVTYQKWWKPATEVIRHMPDLQDLIFHCDASFPRPLLDALHKFKPQCRLHLPNFWFRRLEKASDGQSATVHEDEVAVATSPCLYSIRCDLNDYQQNHSNALLNMVSGMAPNLKEVTFFGWKSLEPPKPPNAYQLMLLQRRERHRRPPLRRNTSRAARKQVLSIDQLARKPWSGPLNITHVLTAQCGSLTKLSLYTSHQNIAREDLEAWALRTHFSKLRVLHLHRPVTSSALEWVVEKQPFKSLDGLWMNLGLMVDGQRGSYTQADMRRFTQSLPTLRKLWWDFGPRFIKAIEEDVAILAPCAGSIEELCFPHDTEEEQRVLISETLRKHKIKPKRLLAPLIIRPVKRPPPGNPWPEWIMANLEEHMHGFGDY